MAIFKSRMKLILQLDSLFLTFQCSYNNFYTTIYSIVSYVYLGIFIPVSIFTRVIEDENDLITFREFNSIHEINVPTLLYPHVSFFSPCLPSVALCSFFNYIKLNIISVYVISLNVSPASSHLFTHSLPLSRGRFNSRIKELSLFCPFFPFITLPIFQQISSLPIHLARVSFLGTCTFIVTRNCYKTPTCGISDRPRGI